MSELFNIPESKSPRLIWMEKYGIEVTLTGRDVYMATRSQVTIGKTEDEAITNMAKLISIPLWNEQ